MHVLENLKNKLKKYGVDVTPDGPPCGGQHLGACFPKYSGARNKALNSANLNKKMPEIPLPGRGYPTRAWLTVPKYQGRMPPTEQPSTTGGHGAGRTAGTVTPTSSDLTPRLMPSHQISKMARTKAPVATTKLRLDSQLSAPRRAGPPCCRQLSLVRPFSK